MSFPDPTSVVKHLIDLLGGPELAFQKIDEEHRKLVAVWEQDASSIGRILRAHLFVEHFLTALITAKNPKLGSLEKARLSFVQKVELLDTDSLQIRDLLPGIRRLNSVRNRLAHTLHADISKDDAQCFLDCAIFRAMREESYRRKPTIPSDDPLDVLEDFSLHAGMSFQAASSNIGLYWNQAIQLAEEEASNPS